MVTGMLNMKGAQIEQLLRSSLVLFSSAGIGNVSVSQ